MVLVCQLAGVGAGVGALTSPVRKFVTRTEPECSTTSCWFTAGAATRFRRPSGHTTCTQCTSPSSPSPKCATGSCRHARVSCCQHAIHQLTYLLAQVSRPRVDDARLRRVHSLAAVHQLHQRSTRRRSVACERKHTQVAVRARGGGARDIQSERLHCTLSVGNQQLQ
jgi:hypothetical protein